MIVPLANWSAQGWRSQRFGESGKKSDEVDVVVMRERGPNLLPDSIDDGCEIGLRQSAGRSKPHEPVRVLKRRPKAAFSRPSASLSEKPTGRPRSCSSVKRSC